MDWMKNYAGTWEFILFAVAVLVIVGLIAWLRSKLKERKLRRSLQSMTTEERRAYSSRMRRKNENDETIRTEFAAMKAMENPQGFDNGGLGSGPA